MQRSRIRLPWRASITALCRSLDDARARGVPWRSRLPAIFFALALMLGSSACTVLVESDAFRTLTAPTVVGAPSVTPPAAPGQPTPVQGATPSPSHGDGIDPPSDGPLPAAWIRDLAWAHLVQEGYADGAVAPDWDDACGPETFCWGAWRLAVRRLSPEAEADRFSVTVYAPGNVSYGLIVTSDGIAMLERVPDVTPRPPATPDAGETPSPVDGAFIITVHSLPPGAAYTAMARIWSMPSQQWGIRGADDTIDQLLEAVRDTGALLQVHGRREEDVEDYGGTRLVVTHLEQEWPASVPEEGEAAVEGWLGRIVPLPASAAYDDYFDCYWPGGQYGIKADDAALARALPQLGDAGELVRIWGTLRPMPDDYGKAQITIRRIELAGIDDDT